MPIFVNFKYYSLNTEFKFGKFKGVSVNEIIDVEPDYIDWCVIHINDFYISPTALDEITLAKPDYKLSVNAIDILSKKYLALKSDIEWNSTVDNYEERLILVTWLKKKLKK